MPGLWGTYTLPTAFKFTPPTESGFFHGMEFSLYFDAFERIEHDGRSDHRFGQTLDLIALRAEFFLWDGSGAKLGGSSIASYGLGLNFMNLTVTGVEATSPSES